MSSRRAWIGFCILFVIVKCLAKRECALQDIKFDERFGVFFDPRVQYDLTEPLEDSEVSALLQKVHSKFAHIAIHYKSPYVPLQNDIEEFDPNQETINITPVLVARYNKEAGNTGNKPLRVSLYLPLFSDYQVLQIQIGYLSNMINITKHIFPKTIERVIISLNVINTNSINKLHVFLAFLDKVIGLGENNFITGVDLSMHSFLTHVYKGRDSQLLFDNLFRQFENKSRVESLFLSSVILEPLDGNNTIKSHLNFIDICISYLRMYYPNYDFGLSSIITDTTPKGSTNYKEFIRFWREINGFAEANNVSVFIHGAFDIPTASLVQRRNSGWWRLIPDGSYRNASDFRFENKLCLDDRPFENVFENVNLTWLKKAVNFHRDFVGVTFDISYWQSVLEENKLASFHLESSVELIGTKFSQILLSSGEIKNKEYPIRIAELNEKKFRKEDKPLKLMMLIGSVNIEAILALSEHLNRISQGIVSQLLIDPKNSFGPGWLDTIEGISAKIANKSLAKKYMWGLLLEMSQCNLEFLGKLEKLPFRLLVFGGVQAKTLTNIRDILPRMKARFEACKRTVNGLNWGKQIEVMFLTGWETTKEEDYVNNLVFWKGLNVWAKDTQTKLIFHTAFEHPFTKRKSGNFGWWKMTSPDKIESKQEIAFRIAKLIQEGIEISSKKVLIIAVACLGIAIIIIVLMATIYFARKRRLMYLTKEQLDEIFEATGEDDDTCGFKMERNSFKINEEEVLGSGLFGKVCKGSVIKDGKEVEVAVKMAKRNCPRTALKGLLSEVKVLGCLGKHENIVGLIGAYTKEFKRNVLFVFLEFCELGSMESYLRKWGEEAKRIRKEADEGIEMSVLENEKKLNSDIMRWAYEIANGMEFIATNRIVHMDLATRNVLLSSSKTAKISDFGLSRRLQNYQMYTKKGAEPLPWRWMAPESLKRAEFTEKSDVWAFGVTLWEICSLAEIPYSGIQWNPNFAAFLENGLRLGATKFNPNNMQKVMQSCWFTDPNARPTFAQLKDQLI